MDIISRQEAKQQGLLFYFTGVPCKRGMLSVRRTDNGICLCEECKLSKRTQSKLNNKYKTDERYRNKKKEINRQSRKRNKEHNKLVAKQYRERVGRDVLNQRWTRWFHSKTNIERSELCSSNYYRDLIRSMYNNAKNRAAKQNIPFTISKDDIIIPAVCPVLNISLDWAVGMGRMRDSSPSLDRVIPEKGYIPGNVVVISWLANRIKSNATLDQLQAVCQYIQTYAATP